MIRRTFSLSPMPHAWRAFSVAPQLIRKMVRSSCAACGGEKGSKGVQVETGQALRVGKARECRSSKKTKSVAGRSGSRSVAGSSWRLAGSVAHPAVRLERAKGFALRCSSSGAPVHARLEKLSIMWVVRP
eukprot:363609-Chlamydomonas_euryale.AAC.11